MQDDEISKQYIQKGHEVFGNNVQEISSSTTCTVYIYIVYTYVLTESLSGSDDCLGCFLRGSNLLIKEGPDSSTAVTGSLERRRERGRWVGDLLGD